MQNLIAIVIRIHINPYVENSRMLICLCLLLEEQKKNILQEMS